MNKAFKGIDDVIPKVDDLKREFAKKEGETLTLSYKINVRILGDFLRSIPALPIIIVGFIIAIKIFLPITHPGAGAERALECHMWQKASPPATRVPGDDLLGGHHEDG